MGTKPLIVTGQGELAEQLAHPSYDTIWDRAVEVFGGFDLARDWMNSPLAILANQTPEIWARSDDASKQREVLAILVRIEYGIFS